MPRGLQLLPILLLLCLLAGAAPASAASAAVVLNEANCEGTDWVELVNLSDADADLSGWLLTDDPPGSSRPDHRLVLPAGTTVPARGDLVLEKGASGFPFGISCGNDTLRLVDAAGELADEVAVPELSSGTDTWGRYPNGTGPWLQTLATKSSPNEPSAGGGEPGADLAAWMFDPAAVVDVDLTLPQESIDALAADPGEYVDGSFSLTTTGGTYGPLEVGVRLKGGPGSFRPLSGKAAFKLKFNHSVSGQRFLGLKKLTLNNMVQDRSNIHELLAYEAFRAVGVAAPRTGYAYVRVNGAEYGLYLNVETLDDVALARWFDSTRHLYEGGYGTDVTPGGAGAFEVDEGSEDDRGDLEALIAAVDGQGDITEVADLPELTRMWAVEKYLGHWDGYAGIEHDLSPNNFYLHSDDAGVFQMLPWGTDQTWDWRLPFDGPAGLMFDRCLAIASCFTAYRAAVGEVSAEIAALDLDPLAASTAALLRPWQERDPRRGYTLAQIDASVAGTRAFIANRPADASAWLAATEPPDTVVPDPELPDEPGPTDPDPADEPPPKPLVGTPKLVAGVLTTRVLLPRAGWVGQRATRRRPPEAGARRTTVCRSPRRWRPAGAVTLRCPLPRAARRALRSRRLALTLRTRVASPPQPVALVARRVMLSR